MRAPIQAPPIVPGNAASVAQPTSLVSSPAIAYDSSAAPRIDKLKAWNTPRRSSFGQPRMLAHIVGSGPDKPARPPRTPPPNPIAPSASRPPHPLFNGDLRRIKQTE